MWIWGLEGGGGAGMQFLTTEPLNPANPNPTTLGETEPKLLPRRLFRGRRRSPDPRISPQRTFSQRGLGPLNPTPQTLDPKP